MAYLDTRPLPRPLRRVFVNRNVVVLVLAQAFLGAQLTMMTVLTGLAGQTLAQNICWATLPITMQAVGSMTTSLWLSKIMQNYGRRMGFIIGVTGGGAGAAICAAGLFYSSFPLFVAGAYFVGIYMSAQGFYRFAAMDAVPEKLRPKALSMVMSAGLVAAIIGPQLTKVTAGALVVPFLGTYVVVIGINVLGLVLFSYLSLKNAVSTTSGESGGRTKRQLLSDPQILRAMLCGMVSYGLMVLVMTSAPLAIVGVGGSHAMAADIVSAHVVAMFLPSFITGHLITKFGAERIVSAGLGLLTAAGIANLSGVEFHHFLGGMILLGFGWNFGFLGATAMLSKTHSKAERGNVQGMNDMFVFGAIAIASFASGSLLNSSGKSVVLGWTAVNLAMVPFLVLAAALLILPSLKYLWPSDTVLALDS